MYLMDIKLSLRVLMQSPKFGALILCVLIGGLTISLTVFSILFTMVYKPLQIPEGDSVLRVAGNIGYIRNVLPDYEFNQVKSQIESFEELGLWKDSDLRFSIGEVGFDVTGSLSEWNMFEFTRTSPILGRGLQPQDQVQGAPAVVVIGYQLWKDAFSGRESAIGEFVKINNVSTEVVGVMPEGYRFPITSDLWLSLSNIEMRGNVSKLGYINAYGRLKEGVSIEEANRELSSKVDQVYQQNVREYEKKPASFFASLQTFPKAQTDGEGAFVFFFLNLIAFFILLLAAINVGNLFLARGLERRKEIAIRSALGAPHGRLILQQMWESLFITIVGGVMVLLLVAGILDYTNLKFDMVLGNGMPFWWNWGLDWQTTIAGIGFIVFTSFLVCFLPATKAVGQNINAALRGGARGAQGQQVGRLSGVLVIVQITLITILLLLGTLAAYISHKLMNNETGYKLANTLNVGMHVPEEKYSSDLDKLNFYQTLLSRLSSKQNILDAYAYSDKGLQTVEIEGFDVSHQGAGAKASIISKIGSPDFVGVRLVEGRELDFRDKLGSSKTAVISQSMAKRYWPNASSLEKRIKLTLNGESDWYRVVGVVSNVLNSSSLFGDLNGEDEVYISGLQHTEINLTVTYAFSGSEEIAKENFFQTLYSVDGSIENVEIVSANEARYEMRNFLIEIVYLVFYAGLFALVLALSGVYGLTENSVVQRTNEIGIRRAVGANSLQIVSFFFRQGFKQLVIGQGIGLLVYALIAYVLDSFTSGLVPWYFYVGVGIGVTICLAVVVLVAVLIPTLKTINVEPSAALRYE